MTAETVGVPAGLAMLLLGERCLGHEGTETGVVGFVGELVELLLGDAEVVTRRLELFADGAESTLDLGPGHGVEHRLGPVKRSRWIVALSLVLAACVGTDTEGGCIELREPEDPASNQHVLTDGAVDYQTRPPTSGPHVAGPTPSGVLATPVPEAIQVRVLEAGGVMIQYGPDVDPAPLALLAGDTTVVAPGIDLPHPIVITAWTWKLVCADVDVDRIERFASERRGDAPGLD